MDGNQQTNGILSKTVKKVGKKRNKLLHDDLK